MEVQPAEHLSGPFEEPHLWRGEIDEWEVIRIRRHRKGGEHRIQRFLAADAMQPVCGGFDSYPAQLVGRSAVESRRESGDDAVHRGDDEDVRVVGAVDLVVGEWGDSALTMDATTVMSVS